MFPPKVAFEESTQHSKTSKTKHKIELSGCAIVIIVVILIIKERWVLTDGACYCAPTSLVFISLGGCQTFGPLGYLLGVQVMENIGKPRQVIPIFGCVHGSATVTTQVCTFQV